MAQDYDSTVRVGPGERENITLAEVYKLLAEDPEEFKTSAIAPEYFVRAFEDLSKTVDEILCVTVSSKLSAGYNNAVIAGKEAMDKMPGLRVRVLDSLSASGGEGLIALAAARSASRGLDLDAVAAAAEQARQYADCLFVFDTLRYVYRTGRMPKVVSQVAGGLGVKPLVQVRGDGKVHFVALFRSREKALERALE
ncbi:MAG: DegV family protein [Chloroflexota bacterium]